MEPQMPPPHGNTYFTADARYKAARLLWEHLTPEQRRDYADYCHFFAVGNETKTVYRINGGTIVRFPDRADFCLHVHQVGTTGDNVIPYEDQLLAMKLIIEKDEDLFLRTANYRGQYPLRRNPAHRKRTQAHV